MNQPVHIFPSIPFATYAFFVALDIPCQIQLQVGLGFHNHISAYLDISVFLPDSFYLLPHYPYEFVKDLLFYLCKLSGIFESQPAHWEGLPLSLEDEILDYPVFLDPSFSRALSHDTLSSRPLKRLKPALLKLKSVILHFSLPVLALEAFGKEEVKLKYNVSGLCNNESLESEKFGKDTG